LYVFVFNTTFRGQDWSLYASKTETDHVHGKVYRLNKLIPLLIPTWYTIFV